LVRGAGSKLLRRRASADTRARAECWCAGQAIELEEALRGITGSRPVRPVREEFPEVFRAAERRAAACPVPMGGAASLDLLYAVAESLEARRVVETGVAYGWSSLVLLLSLSKRPNSLLVSTDRPYTNCNNDRYVGCVIPAELRSHWELIDRPDRDALPRALARLPSLDMCHYDSDKRYEGRMWAYPRLWNALRPGGCFISDDVGDNLAFCEFCRGVGEDPVIVRTEGKYVGLLRKPVAQAVAGTPRGCRAATAGEAAGKHAIPVEPVLPSSRARHGAQPANGRPGHVSGP
jgi:predicted O-methyltransferase YrrM